MNKIAAVLVAGALLAPLSIAHGQRARYGFGFTAASVRGFPSGAVSLAGGGPFDPQAGFLYRQGDDEGASFAAKLIVSAADLDRDLHGMQNVWIEGVGCGEAVVEFR